jgi:hypothetical protein
MAGDLRDAPWRTGAIKVLTIAGIAGGAIAIGNSPIMVTAAETPPEIRQAERNDPAAGEIVIINRKADKKAPAASTSQEASAPNAAKAKAGSDKRAAAPDPYAPGPKAQPLEAAPKKLAPKQSTTSAEQKSASPPRAKAQTKAAANSPTRADRAANPDTTKRINTPARVNGDTRREQAAAPLPPPPAVNDSPRTARARDGRETRRDWSRRQAPASPPARRFERDDADDSGPRRWADRDRDDALYPPPGYRPRGREWRYAERAPRWRAEERRDYRGEGRGRPWRVCRRLAWRCRDGFERACWRWQRQCR